MRSQSDIHRNVTEQIVKELKAGFLPPWRKPWSDDPNAPGLHTSLSTGNPYRGINQLILQCAAMRSGFKSKWWGTFNQIRNQNASVRKGQKCVHVLLWKPICRKRVNEQGKEIDDNFLVMREFAIFNSEQTTGLEQFQVGFSKRQGNPIERYEEADEVISNTNARIDYGGNQPCFRPGDDLIQMPFRDQFDSPEAYYETAFHELVHWSEHESRVGRKKGHERAFGELVAEIGACFLMNELELQTADTFPNSISYVEGWLQAMSDDHRFIFAASAQASKAVDFILSFSRQKEESQEPEVANPF